MVHSYVYVLGWGMFAWKMAVLGKRPLGWVAGSLPSPSVVRMVCWRCGKYVSINNIYAVAPCLLSCLLPGVFQIPMLGRWIYVKAGLQRLSNMQAIEVYCTCACSTWLVCLPFVSSSTTAATGYNGKSAIKRRRPRRRARRRPGWGRHFGAKTGSPMCVSKV